jgi:hypothetical protein
MSPNADFSSSIVNCSTSQLKLDVRRPGNESLGVRKGGAIFSVNSGRPHQQKCKTIWIGSLIFFNRSEVFYTIFDDILLIMKIFNEKKSFLSSVTDEECVGLIFFKHCQIPRISIIHHIKLRMDR